MFSTKTSILQLNHSENYNKQSIFG